MTGRNTHRQHSRYDQALFAAKNAGRLVKFTMACEAYFTDTEGTCLCVILQVDKYDIEVEVQRKTLPNTKLWLKKEAIMATEVIE